MAWGCLLRVVPAQNIREIAPPQGPCFGLPLVSRTDYICPTIFKECVP